ncbi:MAG: hypothetical protein V4543_13820 [Bacteroidota bacterium]
MKNALFIISIFAGVMLLTAGLLYNFIDAVADIITGLVACLCTIQVLCYMAINALFKEYPDEENATDDKKVFDYHITMGIAAVALMSFYWYGSDIVIPRSWDLLKYSCFFGWVIYSPLMFLLAILFRNSLEDSIFKSFQIALLSFFVTPFTYSALCAINVAADNSVGVYETVLVNRNWSQGSGENDLPQYSFQIEAWRYNKNQGTLAVGNDVYNSYEINDYVLIHAGKGCFGYAWYYVPEKVKSAGAEEEEILGK